MSFGFQRDRYTRLGLVAFGLTVGLGCTQTVPSQFKLLPAENSVSAAFTVGENVVEKQPVKIDVLWVIDNSASMLTSQTKLKNGLAAFASDYLMKEGTDIQLGIITTDTFVANDAWQKYLVTENPLTKKTPLEVHKEKASDQRQWGPDYAKLSSSSLLKTKGTSKSELLARFKKLVVVGTQGIYEEHGFGSVEQFLTDNEKGNSPNKLFRKGSQRIIVFLSDEDDQSIAPENIGPEPRKLLYSGSYYTGKDAATANKILPAHFTIDCPNEVVNGATLAPMTLCMRPGLVEGVDRFKAELDTFFRGLDGAPASANPNYFVTAIVGKDVSTIEGLRKNTTEKNGETGKIVITNEVGTRYLDLVNQAGNGSFAMDIGADDYSPILKKIGLEIEKRSFTTKTFPQTSFPLDRKPAEGEPLKAMVELSSGEKIELQASQYRTTENRFEITDQKLMSILKPGDRIRVQYQPATVLPAAT